MNRPPGGRSVGGRGSCINFRLPLGQRFLECGHALPQGVDFASLAIDFLFELFDAAPDEQELFAQVHGRSPQMITRQMTTRIRRP